MGLIRQDAIGGQETISFEKRCLWECAENWLDCLYSAVSHIIGPHCNDIIQVSEQSWTEDEGGFFFVPLQKVFSEKLSTILVITIGHVNLSKLTFNFMVTFVITINTTRF